ncbi:translation initiation factor IF-1 [Candidatus Wolfebacteria bacterium]|nr:translation initiation factor IF-1 [Candidatus Wolfebacteria bacterium]
MSAKILKKAIEGIVIEALPATNFKIKISDSPAGEEEVIGYLAGRMRMYYIKVLPGDRVLVELSPDRKRGRIVKRL